ncbi:MAG: hypothetical protein MUD08_01270 [Cytophagales bacterium]|nr:hypothetical protein [Cytophagales bacterium]
MQTDFCQVLIECVTPNDELLENRQLQILKTCNHFLKPNSKIDRVFRICKPLIFGQFIIQNSAFSIQSWYKMHEYIQRMPNVSMFLRFATDRLLLFCSKDIRLSAYTNLRLFGRCFSGVGLGVLTGSRVGDGEELRNARVETGSAAKSVKFMKSCIIFIRMPAVLEPLAVLPL